MDITKQQAQKLAAQKRYDAKSYKSEADNKKRQARSLHDKAHSQGRGGKLLSLGGVAGKLAYASKKHRSNRSEEEARKLEKEAQDLLSKADALEKEALQWENKVKLSK